MKNLTETKQTQFAKRNTKNRDLDYYSTPENFEFCVKVSMPDGNVVGFLLNSLEEAKEKAEFYTTEYFAICEIFTGDFEEDCGKLHLID